MQVDHTANPTLEEAMTTRQTYSIIARIVFQIFNVKFSVLVYTMHQSDLYLMP